MSVDWGCRRMIWRAGLGASIVMVPHGAIVRFVYVFASVWLRRLWFHHPWFFCKKINPQHFPAISYRVRAKNRLVGISRVQVTFFVRSLKLEKNVPLCIV